MRKLIYFLFISLGSHLFANPTIEYKRMIDLGERLAYNFEFDSCEVIIKSAQKLAPNRPEAYSLKSKLHLWYFLGSKQQNDFLSFQQYSDTTILKIDNLLEKNDEDVDLIYALGNVYKYRAMAYGNNGSTLDAFWATKKAVSLFEDAIELDSNYYSAYGGVGVFEYALSYVPALFNWAISLSGLSADQTNGFNLIKLASQKATVDNSEYKFHLSKLYDEHLAEYEESLKILKKLIRTYPNNELFHYQIAIEYIKSRNLDEAIKELYVVLKINHPKFRQTNSFTNFLLGDIYYRQGNYKQALEYYLTFLTTSNTIDYTGIASLRTAYCYHFLGREKEFKRYALLASNGNLDLEDDKYAQEKSLEVLENGFTKEAELLIEIENSYLTGDDIKCLELININSDYLVSENVKAQVLIIKSRIQIEMGFIQEAKMSLKSIDKLNYEGDKWIKPLSIYLMAKINFINNNTEFALSYLEDAEDNNDYQKKKYIQSLINGLKVKLEQ